MIFTIYNAKDLFNVTRVNPLHNNPIWTNLRIESSRGMSAASMRGPGVYAIIYLERLLYIGKFCGTIRDVYSGDVCHTRWAKHMGTLTLRDRRISFNRNAINAMRQSESAQNVPFSDIIHAGPENVILDPRGRVSSFNRALFASENWDELSKINDANGLSDFQIIYTQISANNQVNENDVRAIVSEAERRLIEAIRPRCNAEIQTGTASEASIEKIKALFETELTAFLEGSVFRLDSVPSIARPSHVRSEVYGEEPDCEERFDERLKDCELAQHAVTSLIESITGVDDAYVQFTCTGGGDLRIRSTANRTPFFNVATLHWQSNLRRFQSEIFLPAEECVAMGATTAKANYEGRTLPTRATFDISIPATSDAIVRTFNAAVNRYRNQGAAGD